MSKSVSVAFLFVASIIVVMAAVITPPAEAQALNESNRTGLAQTSTAATEQGTAGMQREMNSTDMENVTVGNGLQLSHRWSNVETIFAANAKDVYALCDDGEFPISGGYLLARPDLLVVASHAIFNDTVSGWMARIVNSNAVESTTAASTLPEVAVDVICVASTTGTGNASMGQSPEQSLLTDQERQNDGLTITTDNDQYSSGDTIVISGTVDEREAGSRVLVTITDPNGEEVWLDSANVFADNTFRMTLTAGEPQYSFSEDVMELVGNYLVSASYLTPDADVMNADATFRFNG